MKRRIILAVTATAFIVGFTLCFPQPAAAYIGGPPLTLGHMCFWSTHVMIAQIEKIDDAKTVMVLRKVRDVKGKWPTEVFRQSFGPNAGNRGHVMNWAEPGKLVVICALESYRWCHTYVDKEWYASNTSDWTTWNVSHSEPQLLRMFAGKSDRLVGAVSEIVAGHEVVVPAMVDGPIEDLIKRKSKIQRLKASLKLTDYNPRRDFVSFGNDDFAPLQEMPGFSHCISLANLGADVHSIISADFDGDGKLDICMAGCNRVSLHMNGGDFFGESSLPGFRAPCRSVIAADFNGDGRPDLLLATPLGLKLYTNLGKGNFRDDSDKLPREDVSSMTSVACIDFEGHGKPDILLANGYHGLRLYRNICPQGAAVADAPGGPPWFEDVSDAVGLGKNGAGAGFKGETLTVCDVNGDGRPDFLYGAGRGMLFLHTGKGFELVNDSGISFKPGKIVPVFGNFMGDGIPGLFVPQNGKCQLYRGDGKGHFVDVISQAGDLAKMIPGATCAAWGDVTNSGRLDLVVGCLRASNRLFRNNGNGTFVDCSEEVGLDRKIYNTQAVCLADVTGDGTLDMIFNNENQESVVLLGSAQHWNSKRVPLTLNVAGNDGVVGSRVHVLDAKGKVVAFQEVSGGDGRAQPPALAQFALEPGTYRVQVRYTSGVVRGREIVLEHALVRVKIDEQTDLIK